MSWPGPGRALRGLGGPNWEQHPQASSIPLGTSLLLTQQAMSPGTSVPVASPPGGLAWEQTVLKEVRGHLQPRCPVLFFPLCIMSQQQLLCPCHLCDLSGSLSPVFPEAGASRDTQRPQDEHLARRLPFWPPPRVSLVLPGFPALVVGVAGAIGTMENTRSRPRTTRS